MNTLIKRFFFLLFLFPFSCSSSIPLTKIGSERGWYQSPSWSPSGDQIIFQYRPYDTGKESFVVLNSDGSSWQTLDIPSEKILAASMPQWVNETLILYIQSSINPSTNYISSQLAYYDITNETEVLRGLGSSIKNYTVDRSENNFQIALVRRIVNGRDSLMIYDYMHDRFTEIYRAPENASIENVVWDSKGKNLTYTISYRSVDRSQPMTIALENINILSGEREVIWKSIDEPIISSPSWSPDGKWIALRATDKKAGYRSYLLILSANGDILKQVDFPNAVTPTSIQWSPINNQLVIASLGRPGSNSLYLLDISSWLTFPNNDH